jgi:hypothetical protein
MKTRNKKILLNFQLILRSLQIVGKEKSFRNPKSNSLSLLQLTKKDQSHSQGTYSTKKSKASSEGLQILTKPDPHRNVILQVLTCLKSTLENQHKIPLCSSKAQIKKSARISSRLNYFPDIAKDPGTNLKPLFQRIATCMHSAVKVSEFFQKRTIAWMEFRRAQFLFLEIQAKSNSHRFKLVLRKI